MNFSIKTDNIKEPVNQLDGVEQTILNLEQILQNVREELTSLSSLKEVKSSIDALISRLAKNKNSVFALKDALKRIATLYYQAEAEILGFNTAKTSYSNMEKTNSLGNLDDSSWLEEYGLTNTEIRFLGEYYPDLLNALYIASSSGKPEDVEDILNNIRNTLDNDYVTMMEQYGYSYEAIRYLKDNFPVMISSLYATSHWSTADVKKVREAIYNICHEEDICVYDPEYDFDSYNIDPNNFSVNYAYNEIQAHTNCYAYAFGITHNPITGELLPEHGLQPGWLSGCEDDFYDDYETVYASSDNGKTLVHYITQDAEAVDLNFVPYEEGMTGGVRVALVINPIDGGGPGTDYHWYYYDDETGTWSNKQGICPATDCYLPDNYSLYDENIVFSENQGICYGSNGSLIVGDFERPIGDSYIEHAEENGYTVNVGEFYITRQDGGDFQ